MEDLTIIVNLRSTSNFKKVCTKIEIGVEYNDRHDTSHEILMTGVSTSNMVLFHTNINLRIDLHATFAWLKRGCIP